MPEKFEYLIKVATLETDKMSELPFILHFTLI